MAYFAKVEDGIVTDIIVAEQEIINSGILGDPSLYIETCKDTFQNVHINGGTPLRGNYACIGGIYDKQNDVFYNSQPFPSWILNEETCKWEPPIPKPTVPEGYHCTWLEEEGDWYVHILE